MNIASSKVSGNSGSSGSSWSGSSSVDLKTSEKRNYDTRSTVASARSRSFFHCLSKQLGRHFPHHHHQKHNQEQPQQQVQQPRKRERIHNVLAIYNSEDDVHSSSTDSFSLCYERCSTHTPSCQMTGSSVDLTCEDRSSGTSSSASAYSRFSSAIFASDTDEIWSKQQARRHFFVETIYRRPLSGLRQLSADEYSNDSQNDAENDNESNDDNNNDNDNDDNDNENENGDDYDDTNENSNDRQQKSLDVKCKTKINENASPRSCSQSQSLSQSQSQCRSRSISPCSITKGLHLSRISITSSVCRMFQHFTTSSSGSASTRSMSCNNTPLHGSKKSANNSTPSSQSKCSNNKTSTTSATTKKQEKKQQSILRPPVHYVYMKGMSGLYSRVPRYTVCCPYTAQTA